MDQITLEQYAGKWIKHADFTEERRDNAIDLLQKVNLLLAAAEAEGVEFRNNPTTGSLISGQQYGGFRPQSCVIGASGSSHKQGGAIDIFDPLGKLDQWITDEILTEHQLYREAPTHTSGWCHLSTRAPKSGRRTFIP